MIVLAQIATTATLTKKIQPGGAIDRALTRSPSLDNRINASLAPAEDGRIMLRPETSRVHRVIRKIALGLFVNRYDRVPTWNAISNVAAYPYNIDDQRPTPYFISTFTERFRAKAWNHVQSGVFSYIMVKDPMRSAKLWCVMDFHQTLWGVAHIPNPRSVPVRQNRQLWLFNPSPP